MVCYEIWRFNFSLTWQVSVVCDIQSVCIGEFIIIYNKVSVFREMCAEEWEEDTFEKDEMKHKIRNNNSIIN